MIVGIDVKDAKYIIEPNSVFYKLKKGIFDKQYRALFYSEKQINPYVVSLKILN